MRIFLLLLASCFSVAGWAQVRGILIDSVGGKPIDKAVVGWVLPSTPTDTSYTFTDEQGKFSFAPLPSGRFTVVFGGMGYNTITRQLEGQRGQKQLDLGQIFLTPRPKELEEVNVLAAPIIVKEDTIEYRADAFRVKENAVTEDLLKKLPGITVDRDGNVKAQGKDVTRIRVNGKDFFGGDVKTATRELPANIIDKVQVIDDYGDQATVSGIRDGEPDKIINLQIKKDRNKGVFGRATVGAGTEDRYQASMNANYFNNQQQLSVVANSNNTNQSLFNFGGFNTNRGMSSMMRMGQGMMNDFGGGSGLANALQNGDQSFIGGGNQNNNGITATNAAGFNYRDTWGKRVSVYGSYSYSHRNTFQDQVNATQNFFQDNSFINNQSNTTNTSNDNHRFFMNLEWQADSFNYIKFSPNFSFAKTESNNLSLFDIAPPGSSKTSDGTTQQFQNNETPNFNGNLLYNHKFRKRGRNFSTNLSWGTSNTASVQESFNTTNNYSPVPVSFERNQAIRQANDNYNYGIRLTYSEPLSKRRSLDFTASHNLNYARNNRETFNLDASNNPVFVPGLSNDFDNEFFNNRIGVSLRTTEKKYNYTLGISAQPVKLRGTSRTNDSAYQPITRVNMFPIARLTYNFSRSKTLNASYNGNATQPTFGQLQDVLDISNPQFVTRGNPFLKPAITHNLNVGFNNFNFSSGKVLFTNLTVTAIQNQIVNNNINLGNGATLSVPENVNGFFNVLGFYTYSKPYRNRKYVLTFTGNVNFNNNVNLIDSSKTFGRNWLVTQGFNFELNYKKWLQWGMGASFSVNDVRYDAAKGQQLGTLQNASSNALTLSSNVNMDIPGNWVLTYDFDYVINNGLNSAVNGNPAILNASLEKQFFKKKNGILRLSAFDIFNQNINIRRNVTANTIVDSRTNRLARFFLVSFTYRFQKFKGQRPAGPSFPGMGGPRRTTGVSVF